MKIFNKILIPFFFLAALFFFGYFVSASKHLEHSFLYKLENSALSTATVGISIVDVRTDSTVFGFLPGKSLLPASVQKLVTSIVALDKLGENYKYSTKICFEGKIENSVLNGNLIFIGAGDPTLGSKYFYNNYNDVCKQIVESLPVSMIMGDIVIDISCFDSEFINPTWTWQDLGNYYGAGIYGLSFSDNLYELYFNTNKEIGAKAELIKIHPAVPNLNIDSYVTIDKPGSGDNSYIYGTYLSSRHYISGTLAQSNTIYKVKGSVPNPPLFFGELLKEYLQKNGIAVNGTVTVRHKNNSRNINQLCSVISPALEDILHIMNHKSINLFADNIFKKLSANDSLAGTWNNSSDTVIAFIKSHNININGVNVYDGSGLSRFNTITAQALSELLVSVAKTHNFEVFKGSLPIAGISGTMKYFGKGSALEGKVFAKTGTMTRVRSLAGYLTGKSGKLYAFTIIVNGFDGKSSDIRIWMEDLLLEFYNTN